LPPVTRDAMIIEGDNFPCRDGSFVTVMSEIFFQTQLSSRNTNNPATTGENLNG
jgi:hypothetical protein